MPSAQDDLASTQRQLNEARANLKLIQERISEYVLGIDVPLQLIKEERRLLERLAELETKLGVSKPPVSSTPRAAEADLAASVVAICNGNGDIVGTGFVAAGQLILTCAHVVEAAGGGPDELISVRFQINSAQQTAQVVNGYWRAPDVDDVAVLRLADDLPAGVKPLRLGQSIGSEQHTFRSLGYPNVGDYVGIAASGTIEAVTQKTDGRRMVQLTSSQLAQGHSGAPAWDDVQQCVVGMVSEVNLAGKDHKNRDTAFATPAETLWQICPELLTRDDAPRHKRENPFYTRGRINDPAQFFDRERLVREIREELGKRNSVSLVGDSQLGKSSLLYYLFKTSAEWLSDTDIVYVDLQRIIDEADFCASVLEKLGQTGSTLRDLRNVLEARDVVLLLDEVEKLADKDFSPKLHDLLRALAQESNFAMCVATQRPLEDIFPPSSSTSPFHNVFTRKNLGLFSEADARRFLAVKLASTDVTFRERDIERLLRESQCHPAKLQHLAKDLFNEEINA